MFERFTASARQVVVGAQDEARRLSSPTIGTEHLLLALLAREAGPAVTVLHRHGLTREAVEASVRAAVGRDGLDADALATLGIDLDAVRSTVEATFGPGALAPRPGRGKRRTLDGHIPFSPRAKKVLELALRESLGRGDRSITEGHLALGLIREGEGLAMKVICDRGLDPQQLRREIGEELAA